MGNIGDPISTAVPVSGTAGPTYATNVNDLLTEFKARLTAKIPLSSLITNSDLDLSGKALLNAAYVTLANTSAAASPVNRIAAVSGDLYWISPSGAVKLTSGAAINVTSIGGITGDYGGSNPAQFRFTDVTQRYDAYDDFGGGVFGFVRGQGLEVSNGASGANRARLKFATAANVDLTLPGVLPSVGNTSILGVDGNGLISSAPSLNTDITFTGTATVRHGTYSYVDQLTGNKVSNPGAGISGTNAGCTVSGNTSAIFAFRAPDIRSKITSVVIRASAAPAAAVDYSLGLTTAGSGTIVTVTGASGSSALATVTLTPTTPAAVSAGQCYFLTVSTAATLTSVTVLSITVNYQT